MSYQEIKNRQPVLKDCFFAFSNEQFAEGIKEFSLEGQKIFKGAHGLFGTQEGIHDLMKFYDGTSAEISEKCTPKEVYDYEFINHECDYIGDDTDAIKLTLSYFDIEKVREVKRRFAYVKLEDIKFN